MPVAMRAEALIGVAEVIDGPNPIDQAEGAMSETGFAIKERAATLASFPPFGPPDMLYVRKRYAPVVGLAKLYGFYHFVRGVNTSHVASISAYIVDVVRNKGLDPLSWVSAGGWEIASATFMAYNIIAKADAIVHVDFPGSTTATAIDGNGQPFALYDGFWEELLVSSVVRDVVGVGEVPMYPCMRVISPFTSLTIEPAFLDAASKTADRWHFSGIDTLAGTTESAARSRIASSTRDYFIANSRYDAAIAFFTQERLHEYDPEFAVHAAAAARMKGDLETATTIIERLINAKSKYGIAWSEQSHILRTTGELRKAVDAARVATEDASEVVDVWVDLADLYADLKEYRHAMKALNGADMPPPPLDPFLRKLVPNRKNLTTPVEGASQGVDAVRVLANRFREERNKINDKTDSVLAELPGKLMTDAELRCYRVLVKILNDLSWDELLSIRGECFVMETDVEGEHRFQSESDRDTESSEEGTGGVGSIPHSAVSGESEEGSAVSEDLAAGTSREDIGTNGIGAAEANGHLAEAPSEGKTQTEEVANRVTGISLSVDSAVPLAEDEKESEGSGSSSPTDQRLRSLEKIGKKVCKPWLDYLVTNMYQDLRAMASWNQDEEKYSPAATLRAAAEARRPPGDASEGETGGVAASGNDIEDQVAENDYRRSADEIVATTKRPPADWLRRGELALRLGKTEDAKTAFWTCIKLSAKDKVVAVTALSRIMKLSSEDGDIKTTLKCADAIWTYVDSATDRKLSADPTSAVPEVRMAVFRLISKKGLRAVRDILTLKVIELDRKRIEALLLDSVALQVHGFSR